MADMNQLHEMFAVLTPEMRVNLEPVRSSLYQDIAESYDGFHQHALIAAHRFDRDWDSWEMHPQGDEVVVLLTGSATLLLRLEGGDQTEALASPGDFTVVPKGTWHTARVNEPCSLLFITPGENTQHAAQPGAPLP